ncbi:hypothetical protein NEOLEDRAFT_143670 [Neolentinus lepideus HHB14362 ss-1]|uniref:Uncharacterized protein n=1 Tax=Neolentinus lepideus HHB14362 ss-1 TaxID=1314782 RepID=A0A165U0I4_9AGAM|nr:hypothetical protein NEOLEDRAFT_143670 [Neolentinus lepideus HHB14362 ss-1]
MSSGAGGGAAMGVGQQQQLDSRSAWSLISRWLSRIAYLVLGVLHRPPAMSGTDFAASASDISALQYFNIHALLLSASDLVDISDLGPAFLIFLAVHGGREGLNSFIIFASVTPVYSVPAWSPAPTWTGLGIVAERRKWLTISFSRCHTRVACSCQVPPDVWLPYPPNIATRLIFACTRDVRASLSAIVIRTCVLSRRIPGYDNYQIRSTADHTYT